MDKKKVAIIASLALGVILLVGIIISNVAGIKQIKESVTVEAGTQAEIVLNAKEFFNVKEDVAKKITFDTSGIDLTQVGEYKAIAKYNGKEYTINVIVEDTTPAVIADVADQTVYVAKDKLKEQPEVDKSLYSATDNVDGYLSGEKLTYEVTCRDEAKHEWIVKVSYTDRAGNESNGEFLITVKEKKTSGNSGSGSQNNGGGAFNGGNSNTGNTNTGNGGSSSNGGGSASNGGYHPADTDRDGVVSTDEEMEYITPEKQALINAGYGVVCEFDGGTWYAVLMKNSTHTINGKNGWEILEEYMDARGLDGNVSGSYINTENEWYWYRATNIHEKPEEFDDDFWSQF